MFKPLNIFMILKKPIFIFQINEKYLASTNLHVDLIYI